MEVGTNISIQCWNQGYQGTISLYQGGHSAPVQHRNTSGGGMATFTLFGVTPADTSIYWCFYHIADTYLLPSALGGRVMLKVTWGPAPPGRSEPPIWVPLVSPMGGIPRDFLPGMQSLHLSHPTGAEESHGNLVVVMVRGCAAALAFGLGLFFLLAARSFWIHRADSTGGESFELISCRM